ncbi:energy-coupling factor transporter transmembrane protein EcfT [Janibacter terrae]|uniref:Energy-coupling factor transporter transmembrane protein EcfT n=1 Tax=Janibacter terrae TaxID=103817 RepID=A0ABZ2FBC7_9MICO|nr:energy-coupling factor transporter transmembrane component T [Janibacter terrae]
MIGLYRDGGSLLHRLPAGAKLAGLLLAGLVSPFVRSPVVTAVALAVVLAGYATAQMPAAVLLQMLRPLLLVMVPLGVFQTVVAGWERAFVIVGVLIALVLLANLVTLTTRTSDLIDVVVRVCGPLRRVGVDPERVGLMLQLAIRAVPLVIDLGGRVREAQHARGLGASPRAFAVPLVVGALRRADAMGDALAARGLDD